MPALTKIAFSKTHFIYYLWLFGLFFDLITLVYGLFDHSLNGNLVLSPKQLIFRRQTDESAGGEGVDERMRGEDLCDLHTGDWRDLIRTRLGVKFLTQLIFSPLTLLRIFGSEGLY